VNSIERVTCVLDGKQPDRVPLGFYLADCDTVSKVIGRKTYVRNKIAQQIALWEGRRDELAESLKKDTVEFYRKIDLCDVITAKEASLLPPKDYEPPKMRQINDEIWEDEQGRVFKVSHLSNELVCVEDPVAAKKQYSVDDFPDEVEVAKTDESVFEAFDYLIEQLSSERFILGPGNLAVMPKLGGMERGLMCYVENPELVRAAIRYSVKRGNAADGQTIRRGQHGVLFEEDYGTTRASIISPEMFGDFCFPAMKARAESVKRYGQRVFLHSCGNTWELIDMFIEAGIECYQSLQTDAGMDVGKLQRRYGRKLTFWGGLAVETLIRGSSEEVRRNVRQAVRVAKAGGVIIGPSHSIAYGVPYDNFLAMMDEFDKAAG